MNKYTFINGYTAISPLGTMVIVYASTPFDAMKQIIAQENVIRRANGQALITLNPDDYISQGFSALISAFNALRTSGDIVRVLAETVIYPS